MRRGERLSRWRFRIEQHALGPRIYFLGLRWHDWHLGVIVLLALVIGALVGLVHDGFPAVVAALAGFWLIAKDWRDLTARRRDTAAWRLGLHRRPHPLRVFRRADPLPLITALAAASIAVVDLVSAVMPNVRWRGRLLTQVATIHELRVFHALAIPVAAVLFISAYYLYRRRRRAVHIAIALLLGLGVFNLLRGPDVVEAVGDFAVAGVLWWGRSSFYVEHEPIGRRAAFLRAPLIFLAGLLLSFLVVAAAARGASVSILFRETGDLLLCRCERVLPREHPGIRQVICLGSGGGSSCRWASGHRVRLYSELRVFAWYRQANFSSLGMHGLEPGVVRSFTLATRARPGFDRIVHHYGDQYAGWPADFFIAHVRLLATHVARAHFHSIVAPIAARLMQDEKTTSCTGA